MYTYTSIQPPASVRKVRTCIAEHIAEGRGRQRQTDKLSHRAAAAAADALSRRMHSALTAQEAQVLQLCVRCDRVHTDLTIFFF